MLIQCTIFDKRRKSHCLNCRYIVHKSSSLVLTLILTLMDLKETVILCVSGKGNYYPCLQEICSLKPATGTGICDS